MPSRVAFLSLQCLRSPVYTGGGRISGRIRPLIFLSSASWPSDQYHKPMQSHSTSELRLLSTAQNAPELGAGPEMANIHVQPLGLVPLATLIHMPTYQICTCNKRSRSKCPILVAGFHLDSKLLKNAPCVVSLPLDLGSACSQGSLLVQFNWMVYYVKKETCILMWIRTTGGLEVFKHRSSRLKIFKFSHNLF